MRVIEAFPSIEVHEVLACATEPASFCASTNDDHDACLVSLARPPSPAGAEAAQAAETTSTVPYPVWHMLGIANDAFRLLTREEVASKYAFGPANVSVYVNRDSTHAVLHLAEARCMDIAEII